MARQLAEAGHKATVFDTRSHVAGNCFTQRHDSGVMVHVYGPHIFHTQHEHVWDYINRFGTMKAYRHTVSAMSGGKKYQLPMNLTLINDFFGTNFTPEEAEAFITEKADKTITNPVSFEDQALRFVGREMYEAFFKGYTKKQWGVEPTELPASILARLPLRFTADNSYFNHPFQGIPEHGYTPIVEAILDHPSITVHVSTAFDPASSNAYDHVVWTGPIDAYFGFEHGRLGYRTLDFVQEVQDGDVQGCPVLNYCDESVPYTRITEHKHFAPWESHDASVLSREVSRPCGPDDTPYYPIRLTQEQALLRQYVTRAERERGVTFVGRLGTYRYLDMDITIREAIDTAQHFAALTATGQTMPAFMVRPI